MKLKMLVRATLVAAALYMSGRAAFTGCFDDRSGGACWDGEPGKFLLIMAVWVGAGVYGAIGPMRD